ncbi:MAG: hypothetical protein GW748_05160 [Alphaproteobacteria bacterium]|nr:hypothetical protein [Alphaproteobacteria bacterium]NCQ67115.1 hypothetical protein [Alphaproteobacteria bacterium]NCT07712.1 hypothetical protein [Alphaproteobacteria bacterium]
MSKTEQPIIIALVGRVASRFDDIYSEIEFCGSQLGYNVQEVKVSGLIKGSPISTKEKIDSGNNDINLLNKIKEKLQEQTGEKSIVVISHLKREEEYNELKNENKYFYGLGVHTSRNDARRRLRRKTFGELTGGNFKETKNKKFIFRKDLDEKSLKEAYIQNLIIRDEGEDLIIPDKKENRRIGQQMLKTLPLCDYFLNDYRGDDFKEPIKRFLKLILKKNLFEPPTEEEVAMNWAYTAACCSVDQSRQVGSAIVDSHGELLASGCNNVPKFHGGVYRDTQGDDTNARHKKDLIEDLSTSLEEKFELNKEQVKTYLTNSRLGDLLEFSQNVHAEQTAIATAACRGVKLHGSTLYTTTFPCHLCSKLVIAAGITKIIYLCPYRKSFALDLNPNELSVDAFVQNKVICRGFIGTHPQRFYSFFQYSSKREDKNGKRIFEKKE